MMKRVRAARHYQRRDAQVRLLADHAQPGIRRDLKGSLKHLRALVPTAQALHHARAANWAELKRGINWGHFREVLKAPFGRIARLRQASAALGVQKINGAFAQARRRVRFRKDIGDLFNFDLFDSGTAARLRQAQDDLITALEDAARDAIDQVIQFGAINGFGPEEIVDDIRDLIGLNDRYAQAVLNLEATLREDPNLSDEAIQQQVDAYTDRLLDSRADMIAATESSRAANWGLADAYQQAVDRGALPEDAVTKFWQLALDEKTCEVCLSVVDQNPDGVSVSEDFDSIDGPQDVPPVHVSCRCSVEYVTDLDKVPDTADEE